MVEIFCNTVNTLFTSYWYNFRLAEEIQEHNDKAIRDGEEAITHPINAFLLIKGMIEDWNKVVKIMRSNSANDFIRNVTGQRVTEHINYPTEVFFFLSLSLNFTSFFLSHKGRYLWYKWSFHENIILNFITVCPKSIKRTFFFAAEYERHTLDVSWRAEMHLVHTI